MNNKILEKLKEENDKIYKAGNGQYYVCKGNKKGIYNELGQEIIPCVCSVISSCDDIDYYLALKETENGVKVILVHKAGQEITPWCDNILSTTHGYIIINNQNITYIDNSGNQILNLNNLINNFNDHNQNIIDLLKQKIEDYDNGILVLNDNEINFYTPSGQQLFNRPLNEGEHFGKSYSNENNLIAVSFLNKNGKRGLYNIKKNQIIPCKYDDIILSNENEFYYLKEYRNNSQYIPSKIEFYDANENLSHVLEGEFITTLQSGRFLIKHIPAPFKLYCEIYDNIGLQKLFSEKDEGLSFDREATNFDTKEIYYPVKDNNGNMGIYDYNFNMVMPPKYLKILPYNWGYLAQQEINGHLGWDFYDLLGYNLTNAHFLTIREYTKYGREIARYHEDCRFYGTKLDLIETAENYYQAHRKYIVCRTKNTNNGYGYIQDGEYLDGTNYRGYYTKACPFDTEYYNINPNELIAKELENQNILTKKRSK